MMFELDFPAKILWPNGRGHHMAKHRAFQKAKNDAFYAMRAGLPPSFEHSGERVQWTATVHPKTKHPIDRDNAAASLKAYQDGFALALRIDDALFDQPSIHFGAPFKGGKVVVAL